MWTCWTKVHGMRNHLTQHFGEDWATHDNLQLNKFWLGEQNDTGEEETLMSEDTEITLVL